MGCNCGNRDAASVGNSQAQAVADARRAAVAHKPRQIPERLRKYYEMPEAEPVGVGAENKEH